MYLLKKYNPGGADGSENKRVLSVTAADNCCLFLSFFFSCVLFLAGKLRFRVFFSPFLLPSSDKHSLASKTLILVIVI